MKKVTKWGALLLSTALIIGALAGCSKGDAKTAEDPKNPTTIKVGSSFSYYPFDYMDGDKKVGFEVDVWKEIGKRSGLEVTHVQAAYSGLFGMLDKGDIDTIANQVSKNPEREKNYNFSIPYCYNPLKIVVPKGNPENIQSIEEKYPNKEIELVPVETGSLLQVSTGKTSAVINGAAASAVEIKDNDLPLEIVGDALYLEEDAYAFAKTERGDALRAKVDAALKEMHEDGTLSELSNQWFGYDISKN